MVGASSHHQCAQLDSFLYWLNDRHIQLQELAVAMASINSLAHLPRDCYSLQVAKLQISEENFSPISDGFMQFLSCFPALRSLWFRCQELQDDQLVAVGVQDFPLEELILNNCRNISASKVAEVMYYLSETMQVLSCSGQ